MRPRELWVFGYGSLVWRPAIPHAERRPAFVTGWGRRFWQGSVDHRGVPGSPGRVVTLVRELGERCWGMAYRVAEADRAAVLSALDEREKGGYERLDLALHFDAAAEEDPEPAALALAYVATPANPNFLGPASLEAIAEQVRSARGPSGPNVEYVLRLAEALRALGAHDEHVFALAERLEGEGP